MESLLSNYSLTDIIFCVFMSGIMFNMIQDLIVSLINYLDEKAWRVRDYERIISEYICYDNDVCQNVVDKIVFTNNENDYDLIFNAKMNYQKKLQRKEKRKKFLNKFRRKKKDV